MVQRRRLGTLGTADHFVTRRISGLTRNGEEGASGQATASLSPSRSKVNTFKSTRPQIGHTLLTWA